MAGRYCFSSAWEYWIYWSSEGSWEAFVLVVMESTAVCTAAELATEDIAVVSKSL